MTRCSAFVMLVSTVICGGSQAGAATERVTFPLMAWDYADDRATLTAMAECGITSVAFVPPKALDACKEAGVGAIVFDERISGADWTKPFDGDAAVRNLPAVIKEIGDHPAIIGYHIRDEPGAAEYLELAKAVAAIKQLAPGKWPYINLLPGDGEPYNKYVEDFITTCKPTAVSYDRYVLHGNPTDFGVVFWENLAQVRSASLKHKLPYWNIVLTATHWNYREISEADIRLQVWGSLVYGVSGIAYYKFCSGSLPILDAPDLGNFRNGPLDPFGEKTPTWHWLRNVNRQAHNLAPILTRLRSDDVYHFGDVPKFNHGPSEKSLLKDAGNGGQVVVGDFTLEENGRTDCYVMLVNKSLSQSWVCNPTFTKLPKTVSYVSPITGETKKYPAPYYWLAPGQGVLLKLEW
jgi:hypothetical protein